MNDWICPKEYVHLEPINLYCRQMDAANNVETEIKNLHTLYRKKFVWENINMHKVYLRITADDYYMLYINGSFVTQGPANAYHFVYPVNTIDITPYLLEGQNIIAVDTLYNGYVNRVYNSADNRLGLYAEIIIAGQSILKTDHTWKYTFDRSYLDADVTFGYNCQTAEYRDMNLFLHGWTQIDFDDTDWNFAVVKVDDDHQCVDQCTPNVSCEIVKAYEVTILEKGHFILDFGKEIVGQMLMEVKGTKGSLVYTYFGEELNENGSVRYNMRCNVKYEEYCILSGALDYVNNYEYKAFRYIEVMTEDEAVVPEKICVMKRNYPVKNKTVFQSNIKLLEDIWAICENAAIISSQEGYLDCPSREKGQYLGDMMITSLTHFYVTGDTRLYKKAIVDFANSAFIDKGLMAIVPGNLMQEVADFSLLFPQILLNYYHLTGDKVFVKEMLPIAEEVVLSFRQYERDDGLLEGVIGKWNLVDWPDNLRDEYDFELTQPIGTGCHNVINAYYYGAFKVLNQLRLIVGYEGVYDTDALLAAYKNAFYRPQQLLFADSEVSQHCNFHSNVLPLYFEMCDDKISENIVEFIMRKGLCCGVFFSFFVLKGLAKRGYYDKVYELLTNDTIHSWKNMIDEGATCTFEAWGKEQKWNTSLCHPWGSTPIIIIVEDLIGYRFRHGKLIKTESHFPQDVIAKVQGELFIGE